MFAMLKVSAISINGREISLFSEVIISTKLRICEDLQKIKPSRKFLNLPYYCNARGTDSLIAEYGTRSKKTRLHGL